MIQPRLIPVLLLSGTGIVKTIKFKNPTYIGDPINIVRIFNEKEVDEIVLLDINASKQNIGPNFTLIEKIASECFIPLTYGGGINDIQQADRLFKIGVEKICVQTAALKDAAFLARLVDRFGSQSVVLSIDVVKSYFGYYQIYKKSSFFNTKPKYLNFIKECLKYGVGEILLNAVHRDGMLNGPDSVLIKQIVSNVDVPFVYCGGIRNVQDVFECFKDGCSGVAAGSFFVFHGPHRAVLITYPKINSFFDSEKR